LESIKNGSWNIGDNLSRIPSHPISKKEEIQILSQKTLFLSYEKPSLKCPQTESSNTFCFSFLLCQTRNQSLQINTKCQNVTLRTEFIISILC
jgi:hypothetical protein